MLWCSDQAVLRYCDRVGPKRVEPAAPTGKVVEPDEHEDCFGLFPSDLQSNIVISGNKITGTLHHVDNFTGFSSLPEEQSGNYLVTTYSPEPPEAEVYVNKTNGTVGWKKLTKPSLTLVSRITDQKKQKLQVYYELNGNRSKTFEYDLSGLTLENE